MDEIKSVISELPSQDIAILKTLYNPEVAKSQLSQNWQRLIPILDWLSAEEQQAAVDIAASVEMPQEEAPMQEAAPAQEMPAEEMPVEEEKPNPAGNLEDFLI